MTEKENALRVFRREKPEWLPRFEKCMKGYFPKSINERPLNWEGDDWFGIHWVPDASTNGLTAPAPGQAVIRDPERWREQLALPDLEAIDWAAEAEGFRAAQSPERLSMIMMEMGIFERYQLLLGFEDALCSFYEYPDEAGEILEALTQFKLQLVDRIMEHLKPDVVMYMDDLGTQNAPLVAPALWAEFIRARDMRIFRAIHDAGALVVYHCCGKIDTFFDQIFTMGADAYHSVQPANDTAMLKRVYGDQIVLIGGIDNQGITNQPGASEADIRAEVRRAIDAFAPGGGYICGDTDGICVVKRALDIIQDEYEVYGRHYYERHPL